MANAMYDKGRGHFATGDVDWINDTITAYLVDGALYTPDLVNDEFLSDVPVGARVSSIDLIGMSQVGGVLDANDTAFQAVPAGPPCEYIILAKNTGVDATSILLVLLDTANGLPVTPTGTNIPVQWDNGPDKIFKL